MGFYTMILIMPILIWLPTIPTHQPVVVPGILLSYLILERVNYDFAGKYILTQPPYRADGSFRFGPNNRFGYFPSLSVGWNIYKENFMKNVDWVNSLEIKGMLGANGQ